MNEIVRTSAGVVARVHAVNPDSVSLDATPVTGCAGKADVIIRYGSSAERRMIEAIIDGTDLADLPIRWRNI